MFPETGTDVPFTLRNYAYRDSFGRETVTWIRQFENRNHRRFDATMIYSDERGCIVDYLGSHQHLAVDIELSVDADGAMRLKSGEQRFYEGRIGFRFPMLFSGIAEVREWFDDDREQFGIEVNVVNHTWGPLFGYRGWFDVEWIDCDAEAVPQAVKPLREEARE